MYKLIEVSVEEYLMLGDSGVWVYAKAHGGPVASVYLPPDNGTVARWNFEKDAATKRNLVHRTNPRTEFYTRVELED